MRKRNKTYIQLILKEWALWAEKEAGWPSELASYVAANRELSFGEFSSRVPKGCEPRQGYLLRLIWVMANLQADKTKAKYVECVKHWYKHGPAKTEIEIKRSTRVTRQWVRRGERYIDDAY